MDYFKTPKDLRFACRQGSYKGPTSGHALGFIQTNLVILEDSDANEFETYCQKNSKACPILEVLKSGNTQPKKLAPDADISTDLPLYKIFKSGELSEELTNIKDIWQANFVTFLIGCSFSAEEALLKAGLTPKHLQSTGQVPMFVTNQPTKAAGKFYGPLVVSMRPYTRKDAKKAAKITKNYPMAHGGPIQIGDPESLGIIDINKPNYGNAVHLSDDEIPVFWACGVTPQEAIKRAKPSISITHSPGCMFVSDQRA
ncbi:MAG: DUF1445 domain-containing protein [Rhodospirillaceae bacterium]|nr:DUF1445 domain-containing protein [Rhodospirillaceae bacterium]|tara:strand:- start:34 stop:801 length:768 start_codon:yes stop_codon:yes gene_type:complete